MDHPPSSFVGYCTPRTDEDAVGRSGRRFLAETGRTPERTLETPSWVLHLISSPTTSVAVDDASGLAVVLHGELSGVPGDHASELARRLAGANADLLSVHGSFAAIVVEVRRDRVAVITDRINSRRVYPRHDGVGVWLSTSLTGQPRQGVEPDPVGVAWYLSNGSVHRSRTTLEGVSVLERASVNEVTSAGVVARPYWQFRFAPGGADESRLSAELGDLLVAGVRRAIADSPDLFVSLSAGYDATAIVGALGSSLRVPDVRCFSYVLGSPRADSDEHLAAAIAATVGYRHEMVASYAGDLPRAIEDNAAMGEGLKNFVHEVDAWKSLGNQFSELPRPVVLTGDECFGSAFDQTLRTPQDVLVSVGMRGFDALGGLVPHLDPGVAGRFAAGLAEDADAILARCAGWEDLRDCKDFLYLDQRLPNVIAPWREGFAMRFATSRNPLLDDDILDFVATVPSPLRRTKTLFRRTVTRMYPRLFELPRAKRSNYMLDLAGEVTRHGGAVRRLASEGDSPLDALVPPTATLALIEQVVTRRSTQPTLPARARELAKRALPQGSANVVRRHLPPARPGPVDPATLVVRLLILRSALRRR